MSIVVLLVLSGFAVRSNLVSYYRASVRQSFKYRREEATCSSNERSSLEMMRMWCTGRVPKELYNTQGINPAFLTPEQAAKRAEKAKWKTVELFKVSTLPLTVYSQFTRRRSLSILSKSRP